MNKSCKTLLLFFLTFFILSPFVFSNENFPSIIFSSTKLLTTKKKQTASTTLTLSILEDASCYLNKTVSVPEKKLKITNKGPLMLPEEIRKKIQLFFFENKFTYLQDQALINSDFTGIWLSELSIEYKDYRQMIKITNNNPEYQELAPEGYELLSLFNEIILYAEKKD